jgi:hypothetical protein
LIQKIEELRKVTSFDRTDYPSLATSLSGRQDAAAKDIPSAPATPPPTASVGPIVYAERPVPAQTQSSPNGGVTITANSVETDKKQYVLASFASDLVLPDASRFYEFDYQSTLALMIEHVIKVEAPIYEDLVIERISRAHRFQRSGEKIQAIVSKAISRKFPKTVDDGRTVIWADTSRSGELYPYRMSHPDIRSHTDIPVAELASLAVPFVQLLKDDEAVLYAMAEHFKLGRLREPTRLRFQAAIDLARKNSAPTTPVVLAPQASVQLSLTADGSGLPN